MVQFQRNAAWSKVLGGLTEVFSSKTIGRAGAASVGHMQPPSNLRTVLMALALAVLIIATLTIVFPSDSRWAIFLLDRHRHSIFPYPLTIQNMAYVATAIGLADLFVRWRVARHERALVKAGLLPEDDHAILQLKDLGPIRRKAAGLHGGEYGFLPYLIDVTILQLQASRSVDQAVSILTSSLDLMSHKLDLRYQMVRYISWLIPMIGFIGTVVGIAAALEFVNPEKIDFPAVAGSLAVAFYTTLIALILSAVLVLIQHVVQREEETALNEAGSYCLKNLVNRLYIDQAHEG
jgi:MotA/TolQ/ExbB proton channel family